ncbi:MAG: nucleoside phosphorylase [Candidatus Helarchaeales archaeon]
MSQKLRTCYLLLGCGPNAISDHVLMPATPFVVETMKKKFDKKPKKIGEVFKGTVDGLPISIIPTGIGSPSAACKMEGIHFSGKKPKVIRVDYCGALDPEMKIGDIIIASSGLIGDGTTPHYVDDVNKEIPADEELLKLLISQADRQDMSCHVGAVWSHDALLREPPELVKKAQSRGAIAIDMETTVIYALGQLYDISTVAILVVTDNPANDLYLTKMNSFSPKILTNLEKSLNLALNVIKELQDSLKTNGD